MKYDYTVEEMATGDAEEFIRDALPTLKRAVANDGRRVVGESVYKERQSGPNVIRSISVVAA